MKFNYFTWSFAFNYIISGSLSKLQTIYEWKQLNYTSDSVTNFDKYNMNKAVPYDFERAEDGRVFLTVIATKEVPISLTTITDDNEEYGPLLVPYPDSTWFLEPQDCNNITNARSITIDKCNRLWVLDTGRIGFTQICNAKLLVFDLNKNRLLEKHEIPRHISEDDKGRGVLVTPVVDVEESSCKIKSVYIADSEGYALVIWDGREFAHLTGPEFEPVDSGVRFDISGESFILRGGIVPMDLRPGSDQLVFAPLASRNLFAFNTSRLAGVFKESADIEFEADYEVLRRQPTAFSWSSDGEVLFIGLADNSIDCWNRAKSTVAGNIHTVITDNERLQFISSLKVYRKSETNFEEEIWVLTTRLQKIINGSRRLDEINFRILKGSVENLIKGTKCKES